MSTDFGRHRRDLTASGSGSAPACSDDADRTGEGRQVSLESLAGQIRTPFDETGVRWCGDQAAEPGEHHVEWTVDEDIAWGRNAKPAASSGPGVRPGAHCLVLRGQLNLAADGAAVLDLAAPLSEGVAGTWVEVFLEREKVALYPFQP